MVGQAEAVTNLCQHKADVGAAAMDDMGAIHFASQKGPLEVFLTLFSSGVPSKLPPETALLRFTMVFNGPISS